MASKSEVDPKRLAPTSMNPLITLWSNTAHTWLSLGLTLLPTRWWEKASASAGTKTAHQNGIQARKYSVKVGHQLKNRTNRSLKHHQLAFESKSIRIDGQVQGKRLAASGVLLGHHQPPTRAQSTTVLPTTVTVTASSPNPPEDSDFSYLLDTVAFEKEFESLIASLKPLPRG